MNKKPSVVCDPLRGGGHNFPFFSVLNRAAHNRHIFPLPALIPLWCRDGWKAYSVPHGADSVTGLITD